MKTLATSRADTADGTADQVLKEKGRSFHWARRLLNEEHAARATRLYRLCRYLDDLADESRCVDTADMLLAQIRGSFQSGQSSDPVIRDGLLLAAECGIDRRVLCELVDGVSSDLRGVAIADLDGLLRYCYQVAGTVGLMMCDVLDVKDHQALPHAIDLGIAMQLTNICRDVSEDALAGRRYLPASLLGDLRTEDLIRPAIGIQPRLQRCLRQLLDIAERYYDSGECGLAYLPLGARAGILTAARSYRAIGRKLKTQHYRYWRTRVVVSPAEKVGLTTHLLLTAPLTRSFWWPTQSHDPALHLALHRGWVTASPVPTGRHGV